MTASWSLGTVDEYSVHLVARTHENLDETCCLRLEGIGLYFEI